MTNPHALAVVEPVLLQSHGGLFVSKRRMTFARIELTSTRLVVYQKGALWAAFGLLGLLIARALPGKPGPQIELAAIASVARGKYGFNKKILDVTLKDGTAYRITVDRFDEMSARLRDLLGGRVAIAA